jgi:ribosome biogenesis GTPase A
MGIQWYPGHMTKARAVIEETMPSVDVVIEVLDARMPRASSNPLVAELRHGKPWLAVLSKSDLADPAVTAAWLAYLAEEKDVRAIATSLAKAGEARARIPELCRALAPTRRGPKILRAMIVGVPNVGKSSLINTLLGRKVAKVGDEPAVTKSKQQVVLPDGMVLTDHPGLMWPRIDDDRAALRLALAGSIPDSAIDYETVGLFAVEWLLRRHPDALRARYKLDPLPTTPSDALAAIGKKRGALRAGGVIDLHKAADVVVHDFRNGALGKLSLEEPPSH